MGDKPFISVVIPALNEQDNIEPLYERLRKILELEAGQYEILFVDDGSTDGTVTRITALHEKDPSVKLVSLSRNFGHQFALTAGLDHVSGDLCIMMDVDLQHPPEVIPRLLEQHRLGYHVVSGVKRGVARRSWVVETIAGAYYWLLSWLSEVEIDPHASDFRLLDRRVVETLRSTRESTRFLRGLVKWVGFRSVTVPYQPAERFHGAPTYTLRRRIGLAIAGILSFSVLPLRLATITGLISAALATIYAAYAAVERLFFGRNIEGWTSLMIVVLFLGSTQLVFLGIVGEYLGKVFLEVKRRPLYLVRARLGVDCADV